MSSYDCVVPVSWPVLAGEVLPAWCQLLESMRAERDIEAFCRRFAPSTACFYELQSGAWPGDKIDIPPAGYLLSIGWAGGALPLDADNLRGGSMQEQLGSLLYWTDAILGGAIKEHAGFELSGHDAFGESYYGRLHDPPHFQVAGAKSRYRFLENLFNITSDGDKNFCRYRAKPGVEPGVEHLLSALFLARRAFPAIAVLPEPSGWPSGDDPQIQGYLLPNEVQDLATALPTIERRCTQDPRCDELFPLFCDRVRRSAAQGLGLVTLHGGL